MEILGLTGGIASGKSTVHGMFAELGASLLDADAIYHELVAPTESAPSPLATTIGALFPGYLLQDGSLDRPRLGAVVFADPEARKRLEQVAHPAVAAETARRIQALEASGVRQVIYDVPLLYERHLQHSMQGVIVVWVPEAIQVARLVARDTIAAQAAEQRLAAQWPLEEKRRIATWVIDNSGTRDATFVQAEAIWQEIVGAPQVGDGS